MDDHQRGQVATAAAEIYERFFVPALFAEWPGHVLAAAAVGPGDRVLDVACGTGLLARSAAERVRRRLRPRPRVRIGFGSGRGLRPLSRKRTR